MSSDEDISTDEDDSVEANGSLEGFIDPSHSQHLQSGSVDMMAIYRWVYCSERELGLSLSVTQNCRCGNIFLGLVLDLCTHLSFPL